jgi:hypothetical protein
MFLRNCHVVSLTGHADGKPFVSLLCSFATCMTIQTDGTFIYFLSNSNQPNARFFTLMFYFNPFSSLHVSNTVCLSTETPFVHGVLIFFFMFKP